MSMLPAVSRQRVCGRLGYGNIGGPAKAGKFSGHMNICFYLSAVFAALGAFPGCKILITSKPPLLSYLVNFDNQNSAFLNHHDDNNNDHHDHHHY